MAKTIFKKNKILKRICIILAVVVLIIIIILASLWNKYLNRNNLIAKLESPQNQEVYILGTLHKNHFNKMFNYSMEDILSVVENIQPDIVLIEAREQTFKEYGVMDGPIDVAVVYSYCLDNDINVEMIDWWIVDNEAKANTTNDKRDDMIFTNIINKMEILNSDNKVLIVCGSGHFNEQVERFSNNGFQKGSIRNKSDYFSNNNDYFEYPASVEEIWEQRTYFYAYTHPNIIKQDESLNDEVKEAWTSGDRDAFYHQQLEYCELFSSDELYE